MLSQLACTRRRYQNCLVRLDKCMPVQFPTNKEDSMAERNRKKTYLILIGILLLLLLIMNIG